MLLLEQEIDLPWTSDSRGLLQHFRRGTAELLPGGLTPVRFVVTASDTSGCHCEIGAISGLDEAARSAHSSIFEFSRLISAAQAPI